MSVDAKIHFRPRPVLILALGMLLALGLVLQFVGQPIGAVANGTKQHGHTTTTVAPTPPAVSPLSFSPPGRGCAMDVNVPATAPAKRHSAPIGHCTVLEIGDSLGVDLGYGLYHQLPVKTGVHFISTAKVSTGLVNTNFYNWPVHLHQALALYHPHLVIISMGANDNHPLAVHGASQLFGNAAWRLAYTTRARALIKEATATGAYVLWVGMPIMQNPIFGHDMQIINSLARTAAVSSRGAAYLSTWPVLAAPNGKYRAGAYVNHVSAGLRGADGIHMNNVGSAVVATYVTSKIGFIYHVALQPAAPSIITG